MKTSRVILIIVIALFVLAITVIIIKLKKPSGNNMSDLNTGGGAGTGTGGGTGTGTGGGSSSGTGGNLPPAPTPVNWSDFKAGERVFAILPVNAWDRDIYGYHGTYGHVLKVFTPGAYIGTVSSIIPLHGLMVKNNNVSNPNLGDPFFIQGSNNSLRKG